MDALIIAVYLAMMPFAPGSGSDSAGRKEGHMRYRRYLALGMLGLACSSLPGTAIAGDCRLWAKVMHCFDVPAPEKFTDEQMAERQRLNVQQELAALAPLSRGTSAANCDAALSDVARQARSDPEGGNGDEAGDDVHQSSS